jgi:hypothetical protein
VKAAGDLRGAAGQAKGRYRWRNRRGKTLRGAADGLIVKTGHQYQVWAASETSTREAALRTAVVYRTRAKALKTESEQANYGEPDDVQFEMCEFTDGRVAQRWRVGARSCAWWDSLQDLYTIHIYAHPEYGTRIEWSDGHIEEL